MAVSLIEIDEIRPLMVCPRCRSQLRWRDRDCVCTNVDCIYAGSRCFPMVGQHPVLVDFERSILGDELLRKTSGASPIIRIRRGAARNYLKSVLLGENKLAEDNCRRFRELISDSSEMPMVLVVGGGTVGSGSKLLYQDPSLRVVAFDIYASPITQFIADSHQIPLMDGCIDGVWIQAVLEHVLNPWQVVDEIHRVLKPKGIVYSDTPFMQHVHEGAYDFTRFTESGHRWLFRAFERIDSGASLGVGMQLSWALGYTVRSVLRSNRAGILARMMFFWLRFLDRLAPEAYNMDSASSVYFLGRRSLHELTPKELIEHYKGAF